MDPILISKYLAIPTAFLCGGYQFAHSQNILPSLSSQPASISTPLFTKVYYEGFKIILPGAVGTALAYGYLAYRSTPLPNEGILSKRNLYATGALYALGVGAWTGVVMKPGIERLIEIGKNSAMQVKAESSGEALKLLKAWTAQNWVRTGMWVGAGLAGLMATL